MKVPGSQELDDIVDPKENLGWESVNPRSSSFVFHFGFSSTGCVTLLIFTKLSQMCSRDFDP